MAPCVNLKAAARFLLEYEAAGSEALMQAGVMSGLKEPLRIRSVPVPAIAEDEVLVATHSCGICGTDLHILEGQAYMPKLPHILGHEPAGVVARIGRAAGGLKPGDRVIPYLFFNCGECYYCRVGRHQQCLRLSGILGVMCHGGFAEYFKAPARNLFRLPDNVPFDVGGLIVDAVITAVHAARRAGLYAGQNAVVLGVGGVGLCLVQVLVNAGINVTAVDLVEAKLELARRLGAAWTARFAAEQANDAIRDRAGADGIAAVFDCVGSTQSLAATCRWVRSTGRVVVIGESGQPPAATSTEIAQRELEIIGSRNGTRQDLAEAIGLVERGVVQPPIAAHVPLEDLNTAFDLVRAGPIGRVVVVVRD